MTRQRGERDREEDSFSRRYRARHAEMSAKLLEGLVWYGSSLSLLMNPAGPDLATISQLHHTVQNPLLMKGERMSSENSLPPPHVRRLLAGSSHSKPTSIKEEAVKMSFELQLSQSDLWIVHLPHNAGSTSIIPNDVLYFS